MAGSPSLKDVAAYACATPAESRWAIAMSRFDIAPRLKPENAIHGPQADKPSLGIDQSRMFSTGADAPPLVACTWKSLLPTRYTNESPVAVQPTAATEPSTGARVVTPRATSYNCSV